MQSASTFSNTVIVLTEGAVKERIKDTQMKDYYEVNLIGMYIIVKTLQGLTLMWDQKTSVTVQLEAQFQGKVCGMCGNFDGMVSNDFTSRYQSLETSEVAFGNSWQVDSSCPGSTIMNPCSSNPFRQAWAQKHCSIIKSPTFASCHSKVNPVQFFEACVSDTCSCDTGGDCQCLCTAIAAYSSTCREAGICINWRSPEVCPVFCDFYNYDGHCTWHYKPCGDPCLRTCKNPQGNCDNHTNHLEGCYPRCSTVNPYYDEDQLKCVSALNCTSCQLGEKLCTEDLKDCLCCYNGKTFKLHEEVYNITDGLSCTAGICGLHGNIIHASVPCGTVPTALPYGTQNAAFSSSTKTTTTSSAPMNTTHVENSTSSATVNITMFVKPASPIATTTVTSAATPTHADTSGSSTTVLSTQPAINCYIVNHQEIIKHNNCTSTYLISIPSCEGHCGTSSIYSHETGTMTHKCSCCHETKTRSAEVDLLCVGGSSITYRYVYVEECSCTETECQANQSTIP
ncbi:hypothetical protein NDU88_003852 [Pleurodeles waltl]|uniref:Uncharacterized protein n=1 Tax=Pleurodeles waltl TaxID=8319 RepID=A0AAV7TSF7_PLEWA|nr:hypothetical protein NDU88_003852 [Pleurodeles waltl]